MIFPVSSQWQDVGAESQGRWPFFTSRLYFFTPHKPLSAGCFPVKAAGFIQPRLYFYQRLTGG